MKVQQAHQTWNELLSNVQSKKSQLDALLGAARQNQDQIASLLADLNTKKDAVQESHNIVNQNSQFITERVATITQKETEAQTELEKIERLVVDSEEKNKQIDDLKEKTQTLIDTNSEQSTKISDLLQKAAGGNLFQSFNLRKKEHSKSANLWAILTGAIVLILIGLAIYIAWIAHVHGVVSYEFVLKLSISFPIIYGLYFASRQYNKFSRLEEEYAFKSAISLSLEAYRDLIKKEAGETTKEQVIPFITGAVTNIFSSPSVSMAQYPNKEEQEIQNMGILDKILELVSRIKG